MFSYFNKKNWLLPLAISLSVCLFIYRGVLLQPFTHLTDPYDFPYYGWLLDHVLQFLTGNHSSLFTTNTFFSFENSYFFSDLLIPQALVGLIPYLLGFNPIAVTNSIVIGTIVLNILASIFFWRKRFQSTWALSFLTLATALSPFVILQRGHLQMITIWPFLLIFSLLLDKQKSNRTAVLIGLLWTVQLLASAYLAIFLIVCVGWLALLELVLKPNKKMVVIFYLILGLFAGFSGGPILLKYKSVQQAYNVTINYGEYVTYNAHLTDYLFLPYQTLGQQLTSKWQQLNQHNSGESAIFPGLSLTLLSFFGMFGYKKYKNKLKVDFSFDIEHLFFVGLLVIGFTFSLGPRLFVNGAYVNLPLPYAVPLKFTPLFTAIRATARWSWLVFIGLAYFSGLGLAKFKKQKTLVAVSLVAIVLYIIEIVPIASSATDVSSAVDSSHVLVQHCDPSSPSLLIFPITQQHQAADMFINLKRKTQHLLRSTQHTCQLVNGYGGFEPPQYKQLESDLNSHIQNNDLNSFLELAKQNQINMLLLESAYLAAPNKQYVDSYINENNNESGLMILEENPNSWYLLKL